MLVDKEGNVGSKAILERIRTLSISFWVRDKEAVLLGH